MLRILTFLCLTILLSNCFFTFNEEGLGKNKMFKHKNELTHNNRYKKNREEMKKLEKNQPNLKHKLTPPFSCGPRLEL